MAALTLPLLHKKAPVLPKHNHPWNVGRQAAKEKAVKSPLPHDPTPKPWMRKQPKKTINFVTHEDKVKKWKAAIRNHPKLLEDHKKKQIVKKKPRDGFDWLLPSKEEKQYKLVHTRNLKLSSKAAVGTPISTSNRIWWTIANLHSLPLEDFKRHAPGVSNELYQLVQKKLEKNKAHYSMYENREDPKGKGGAKPAGGDKKGPDAQKKSEKQKDKAKKAPKPAAAEGGAEKAPNAEKKPAEKAEEVVKEATDKS